MAMKGNGYYDQNSLLQRSLMETTSDRLELAVNSIVSVFSSDEYLQIADYGCSEGRNSILGFVKPVIDFISKKRPGVSVSVILEDQPSNDFSTVSKNAEEFKKNYPTVYFLMSAGSFFTQIIPNSSLHLGFSSSAVHWLSQNIPLVELFNENKIVEENYKRWSDVAKDDWESFLKSREKELKSGGQMVICVLSDLKKGNRCVQDLFNILHRILIQMKNENIIEKQEMDGVTCSVYFRNMEEIKHPFQQANYPLRLLFTNSFEAPNPLYELFLKNQDANEYASALTKTIRAFLESSIRRGLSTNEKIDDYFRRMEKEIRDSATTFEFKPPISVVHFEKK
jgi:hypothetical protein